MDELFMLRTYMLHLSILPAAAAQACCWATLRKRKRDRSQTACNYYVTCGILTFELMTSITRPIAKCTCTRMHADSRA